MKNMNYPDIQIDSIRPVAFDRSGSRMTVQYVFTISGGRLIHFEDGFLRIGRSPRRLVICRRNQASYTTRTHGWRIGNWYVYFEL